MKNKIMAQRPENVTNNLPNNNNNNNNNNDNYKLITILLGSIKFFTKTLHDNYLQHKTIYNNNCIKIVKKKAKCSLQK